MDRKIEKWGRIVALQTILLLRSNFTGFVWVMETLEIHGILQYNFIFQSWKVMKICVWVMKNGNMIVMGTKRQEIPQTNGHFRNILKQMFFFLDCEKHEKDLEKVLESCGIL